MAHPAKDTPSKKFVKPALIRGISGHSILSIPYKL